MTMDLPRDVVMESSEPTDPTSQVCLEANADGQDTAIDPELPRTKSKEEYTEMCILRNAMFTSRLPSTASEEEKKSERTKILNDRHTRWRFIFNNWPRDPNGKLLIVNNSLAGKMAGGGRELNWGATLADLYDAGCDPRYPVVRTVISGSKMYNWCQLHGENYEPARQLMEFSRDEEAPHVVPVYSLEDIIRKQEHRVVSKFECRVRWYNRGDAVNREPWEPPSKCMGVGLPLPTIKWPPKSSFHVYPAPWPFTPFQRESLVEGARWANPLPTLQEYIPQHLLPEKLVVHDPWNLLAAVVGLKIDQPTQWGTKKYMKYRYKLEPSKINTTRCENDQRECERQNQKSKAVRDAFLANPLSGQERPQGMMLHFLLDPNKIPDVGPSKPPVFIVFQHRPAPKPAKKAHLFLSPAETLGQGHHSFVYRAEFEIPRSLVIQDEICEICVHEDVKRILLEEDGPNGERRDPKWDDVSGEYVLKEVGRPPVQAMVDGQQYELIPGTLDSEIIYEGPYRAIETTVEYQNPPYCEHLPDADIHPLTTKTLVAAKLSIQGDPQLNWEAQNYQTFPRDFFEHYNGFNMVKPLRHPTPVGAIVPQFYGYYALDEGEIRNRSVKDRYLSPILLLEDCGKAVVPEELTLDDREECASLAYRLHLAGWLHNSLAWRNIVRQPGPLSMDPELRQANASQRGGFGKDWSFRLIDFGRSGQLKNWMLGKQLLEQM
ncbi:hypothetical protein GALMADRAFT_95874 [Galerina marginata CBS 339.88]|uniref:Protein kinase domain-containing protein n=1 Tax=Galerina marginata (strain CBS 339.88) TaxID=685588 RepID=A0A067T1U8_GALM3|nr:hypothetical protein GALMADRAFT_95874 [Galerina marginata CBS 339.88]